MTEGRFDQLFFGWNQQTGKHSVLADSFGDGEDARRCFYHLKSHLRLQRMREEDVPEAALSYLVLPDGVAAVLRRVSAGVNAGRNNSHALVGPTGLLTPRVALGLSASPGWLIEPPSGSLKSYGPELAADAARRADEQFRPAVSAGAATLVPIVAGVLGDPRAPISVIGCPEHLKTTMLWALLEIAEKTRTGLPEFSFSTYEIQHDGSVPHIVFLPARPYERVEVARTVVDLSHPDAGGSQTDAAQVLCQQLVAGKLPAAVGTRSRPIPVTAPSAPPVPPASPVSLEGQMVAALRQAEDLPHFDRVLSDLEARPRHLVRAALDAAALDDVALRVEVDFREELLHRLLTAVYGPDLEDLADSRVQAHAIAAVRDGRSEQLALMIGKAGGSVGKAAYKRWAADARGRRSDPGARIVRRLRAQQRARYLPVAALVAVAAVLGVAFLSGLLLGRSEQGPAAAAGAPQAPPAARIAGGFASIGEVNPNQATVVAFAKVAGGRLVPQGPCVFATEGFWFCPSRADLPPDQYADLVAYVVPKGQAATVLEAAGPQVRAADWGLEHPVR
ncbi:hypothetical protein OHA21_19135 [Actinoplanes sp. NBC_00393]|uniref:hypothetical protein n=1 Tax=Actinoplanes sp. NBC_00393 TaxID=2975953 RepID=UPI002E2242E9